MLIRIEASQLPGREWGQAPGFPGCRNIHVGVQRRERCEEFLDLQPGDAAAATRALEATARATASGWDLRGPYVQGRPGGRFICLSWGTVDDGVFTTFRRGKLWFNGITPAVLYTAVEQGCSSADSA